MTAVLSSTSECNATGAGAGDRFRCVQLGVDRRDKSLGTNERHRLCRRFLGNFPNSNYLEPCRLG